MKPAAEAEGRLVAPVGEHSGGAEARGATPGGASGKANVGISNDKERGTRSRRKTEVSRATLVGPGSVGP